MHPLGAGGARVTWGPPEVDVIDKSQAVVGGTLGERVEGTQAA